MHERILRTAAPKSTLLIRLLVGGVFLSEGIQKFLYPAAVGVGRFVKIGIPWPEVTAPFVGVVEIVCGTLVLIGLLTRPAAFILLVNITVAIFTTKIPILIGRGFWCFSLREMNSYGFWSMAHESRTDISMWLGSLFLVIVGAGILSLDYKLSGRKKTSGGT